MEITGQSQIQTQMRKMDGSGDGGHHGKGGMGQVMQSLDSTQRVEIQEELSLLSQEDRKSVVEQIKEVDTTTLSSEDLMTSILDIIDNSKIDENTSNMITEVYA